jgi:Protein of unknown function (DUF3631)
MTIQDTSAPMSIADLGNMTDEELAALYDAGDSPASAALAEEARQARISAAKTAGCRHATTKFGTPRQCGDCPAPGPDAALAAEIAGPGRIVPGEQEDAADFTPGDMKHVLDETAEFVARYVVCTQAQADVMTLFPAAANALAAFPAFGEVLFTANTEQAGKTTGMAVTAALCANPVNAKGTVPALQSELAAASNEPEKPAPVLYYDEIGGLYGASGLNRGGNWVLDDVLRDGYKNGATRKWSVNRSAQEFSIHVPVLMTGRGTSLPRDIRTRTIVIRLEPATPKAYFDMREAEPEARALAACLAQAVSTRIQDIAAFRARGIHPQLAGRKLEVWEPLFAVAYILGGQEWLNRCLAAFRELAIAESEQVVLTPRQQVLRDAAQVLDGPLADMAATGFVGGLALADEMRRLGNLLYASRSEAGMAKLISEAMSVPTTQKRVGGKPVRGYFAFQITEAWEAVRPAGMEDASIAEEENPFAVTDDTDEDDDDHALTCGVTGEAGVTA